MKRRTEFYGLISIELGLLAGVIVSIYSLNPSVAESLYLYEFLGALMALLITTYGVYKMQQIT